MKTENQSPTLAQIVHPLVAVLNYFYPVDPDCPWEVVSPGQYCDYRLDDNEVAIPLDHEMSLHGMGAWCLSVPRLLIDHDGELDVDAAIIQISKLVARLADPESLVPLSKREQAKLF